MQNQARIIIDAVFEKMATPTIYTPSMLGAEGLEKVTGAEVKICILDSGTPNHKAIVNKEIKEINFTDDKHCKDTVGHATVVAGLIAGNKEKEFKGIAPDASIYCSKMINDECVGRSDSMVAGILWGIINNVDIISIPLSTEIDSTAIKDMIKKAYSRNICIIASVGNEKKMMYPAKYPEVLNVGATDGKSQAKFSKKGRINLLGTKVISTYIDQTYATVSGTSISTAFATGLTARCIELMRKNNEDISTENVYKKMENLLS